jgi:predicted  nucleic acid-binding Zn-ribbon protein
MANSLSFTNVSRLDVFVITSAADEIERLRPQHEGDKSYREMLVDARAEIERLRKELASIKAAMPALFDETEWNMTQHEREEKP